MKELIIQEKGMGKQDCIQQKMISIRFKHFVVLIFVFFLVEAFSQEDSIRLNSKLLFEAALFIDSHNQDLNESESIYKDSLSNKLLELACFYKNNEAKAYYGKKLILGKIDRERGIKLLKDASVKGSSDANIELARISFTEKNIDNVLYYLKKADSLDVKNGSFELGFLFLEGTMYGFWEKYEKVIDKEKGMYYLEKSAKRNHFLAQYNLAFEYLYDDNIKAVDLFFKYLNNDTHDNEILHEDVIIRKLDELNIKYEKELICTKKGSRFLYKKIGNVPN